MDMTERYTESRKHWYIVIVCRIGMLVGILFYLDVLSRAYQLQDATALGNAIGMIGVLMFSLWQGRGLRLQHLIERIKLPPLYRIPVDTGRYASIQDLTGYPALTDPAGYVYLIREDTQGHFKIGRTRNPQDRLSTFNVKLPFMIDYICLIPASNMRALESRLHHRFASKRVNGEWFALSPADVDYIKSLAQE
jgi:hypothetical protein